MLLVDHEIRKLALDGMIEPYSEAVKTGVSFGLSSAGYDLRMDVEVLAFKNTRNEVVDPVMFRDAEYVARMFDRYSVNLGDPVVVPAHGYILVQSLEYLRIPRNVKGRCVGKSTYARCGVIANTTPLEPEWEGHLTIEIGNSSPSPVKLWTGQGIVQLEFELLNSDPEMSYKDKGGKYQDQKRVTPARVL